MASYDFSTLNDRDLEQLAVDILSKKLGHDFQSFKPGPDMGIDSRYSSINDENEIVIQVKHLAGSGVTALKTILKNKELSKVNLLNPKRYIVVTSLALSPQDKEKIKNVFNPYILSTQDILGKDDLNAFLRNNPDIEEMHFKIWLSSTGTLKRIIKNGIKTRSEFHANKITKDIKLFVPNKAHSRAVEILNKNNFILITGAPGIGKSTLANMLTYQLLAEKFELVYVREITEAEDLLTPDRKQVFYFDDFLGSITLDLKSSRNADSAIINFIDIIKNNSQKKLILTCRTTLLNQAKEISDKINDSKIDIANHEIHVADYRNIDKAKILYNHIYISKLSDEQKKIYFMDFFYWKIIKHKHYNPRVIEYFTDSERIDSDKAYDLSVMDFLNKPSLIWEKPFTRQISPGARMLLITLYSLGSRFVIYDQRLKDAFYAKLEYESKHGGAVIEGNDYETAVKETVSMFINRTSDKNSNVYYTFFNPSIEDFLYDYFNRNKNEYLAHLKSASFYEQFKERITGKLDKKSKLISFYDKKHQKQLLEIFLSKCPDLTGFGNDDLNFMIVLIRLFHWDDMAPLLCGRLNSLNDFKLGWTDRENLVEILIYVAENNHTGDIQNMEDLILMLSKNIDSYYHIESLSNLISRYNIYNKILENIKNCNQEMYRKIIQNLERAWSRHIDHFMQQTSNLSSITSKEEMTSLIAKRKQAAINMTKAIYSLDSSVIEYYDFKYDLQIEKNKEAISSSATHLNSFLPDNNEKDENREVNRLFNSNEQEQWYDLPF